MFEASAIDAGLDPAQNGPPRIIDNDLNTYYGSNPALCSQISSTGFCEPWVQLDLNDIKIVQKVNIILAKPRGTKVF